MTRPAGNHSINPASGYWGTPNNISFAIPESLSSSLTEKGFEQQTFLGASIRSVSITAGFGDSASTLGVELVNDEYNQSDRLTYGLGDDVYHNGLYDKFSPPPVGSPVFFKLGKNRASVQDAYLNLYDQIYGYNEAINSPGRFHLCFGGILQSYVQNRGPNGNPLYSVSVVDPREILSNTVLILRNYAGTIFNNKNIFNLHGFLEFNTSQSLQDSLRTYYKYTDILTKYINPNGTYYYSGNDMYHNNLSLQSLINFALKDYQSSYDALYPETFPITGTGFSRSGPQGVPYYRVRQALDALLGIYGQLPEEYVNAGFGGFINFRGFNYIVDLSGLPEEIPDLYYLDFDQINLLDFCLEMCDITSKELFISLLPIIDHPVCSRFYTWNNNKISENNTQDIIAGIIKIECIDKSFQPQYGAIKSYIDNLTSIGINVENQDVGFELSNVTTDKFVIGAQEVDMYYFSSYNDRGNIRSKLGDNSYIQDQWKLDTIFGEQIIPYYGMLGKAISIPKGFGAYQQILLDSSSVQAYGVGNYYIATEMELRAALISYERWSEFLIQYNDIYMQSIEDNDEVEGTAINIGVPGIDKIVPISNNYAVTVPRCVWPGFTENYDSKGLPVDPCHPPYGYPLYYKRAERIGINAIGISSIQSRVVQLITDLTSLDGDINDPNFVAYLNSILKDLENIEKATCGNLSQEDAYKKDLVKFIKEHPEDINIKYELDNLASFQKIISKISKRSKENATRVYNFIKKIAEECIGKKFLVKIPRYVNPFYNKQISLVNNNINIGDYEFGPFGFKPRAINTVPGYEYSQPFLAHVLLEQQLIPSQNYGGKMAASFLKEKTYPYSKTLNGALDIHFNPINEQYEYNYIPEPQGGYIEFDLLANISQNRSLAINQGLAPIDLTYFVKNNRLGAYVRFDNSQDLGFEGINSEDFTQQTMEGSYLVSDISSTLDNLSSAEFSLPNIGVPSTTRKPSIAFVKCEVDEKLYMPPKSIIYNFSVHATQVIDKGVYPDGTRQRLNPNTCECEDLLDYYTSHYIPKPSKGQVVTIRDFIRDINTGYYKTSINDLDTNNVYALITLPNQIVPLADKRFQDGYLSNINSHQYKHLLTMDVVKLPEFNKPAFKNKPPTNFMQEFGNSFSPATISAALNARSQSLRSLQFGLPQRIQAAAPSPVFPNLVVLPLRSTERCYGPWVSNQLDVQGQVYNNIAGRVEFVKDENLAPWNFNGYDLMNSAGILQARFSNSLLLQSERGGFVIPEAPSGIYLGKFLSDRGPLVTNISIDISDAGVRTTYKMDLYTSSFGKLAKQKQEQIANISRERQKLKDERNALIRKGLAKHQVINIQNAISQTLTYMNNKIDYGEDKIKGMTHLYISHDPYKKNTINLKDNSETSTNNLAINGGITNPEHAEEVASLMEPKQLIQNFNRSASMAFSNWFKVVDNSPAPNPYLNPVPRPISNEDYYKTQ